jgi:hypothetical protein
MIQMSLVWAATMLAAAIAAKASDEFFWVLLILITGAGISGAVIESARRRAFRPQPLGRRRRNPEARRMAMAATTLFTIGAAATCTDGACGMVSRSVGGRDAVDVAGSRPRLDRAFRWPFTAAR